MSDYVKGRGVKVEVAFTYAAAVAVNDVSLAKPGIVSLPGHGLAIGSCGYFTDVDGMDQLDGQAFRVAAGGSPTADEFALEGLDTSDYTDWGTGKIVAVTGWRTLAQATQYNLGGGAPRTEDVSVLLDKTEKTEIVKLAAETATIDLRSLEVDNDALTAIRDAAAASDGVLFRVTLSKGAQRVFYGSPSVPGEQLATGSIGSGQITVAVKGRIMYLAAL